jgi:DNA-binding beta-propeller fold protein YncE
MKLNVMSKWAIIAACVSLFGACKPADDEAKTTYGDGIFITCEGAFGTGTGTVSYYDRTSSSTGVRNDIFRTENGGDIGNILQSMAIFKDKAYLIANNADKMHIVDTKTFKLVSTITGFKFPNNFLPVSNSLAYISEWGDNGLSGRVKVFSLDSSKFVRLDSTGRTAINTGKGAANMVQIGNRVWVVNNGGTNGNPAVTVDSTVAILDIKGDSLIQKIQLGGFNPNSIVVDANGDVWVLCSGFTGKSSVGKLVKIKNNVVERSFDVPFYSSKLTADPTKQVLYYAAGNKVYRKDILNFGANSPTVFSSFKDIIYVYGIGVDPKTGDVYVSDAKNFSSSGRVYIHDANKGTVKDSLAVGITPNGFVFQ